MPQVSPVRQAELLAHSFTFSDGEPASVTRGFSGFARVRDASGSIDRQYPWNTLDLLASQEMPFPSEIRRKEHESARHRTPGTDGSQLSADMIDANARDEGEGDRREASRADDEAGRVAEHGGQG